MSKGSVTAALIIIAIVAYAIIAYYPKTTTQPTTAPTTTSQKAAQTTIQSTTPTITPGSSTAACPAIFSNQTFDTSIVSYSNVQYYNDSSTAEFVMPQGTSGILHLNISKPTSSTNMGIGNFAEFFYSENGANGVDVALNSTNGVSVAFNRTSESLTDRYPTSLVTVTISIEDNASSGTYLLILPEGPCKPQGVSFLLTVGSNPYNGTIAPVVIA